MAGVASPGGNPIEASASTASTSSSVICAALGSPSYAVSVVPGSSIPIHGTAKRSNVSGRSGRCVGRRKQLVEPLNDVIGFCPRSANVIELCGPGQNQNADESLTLRQGDVRCQPISDYSSAPGWHCQAIEDRPGPVSAGFPEHRLCLGTGTGFNGG